VLLYYQTINTYCKSFVHQYIWNRCLINTGQGKDHRLINTGPRKRSQMHFKLGMEKTTDELILGKEKDKEYR
jgi:hypothetical protein